MKEYVLGQFEEIHEVAEESIPEEAANLFINEAIPTAVNSTADANRRLWALKKLKEEQMNLELDMEEVIAETREFYRRKIEAKQKGYDFLAQGLEAYVRNMGHNLSLPNGRAEVKRFTQKEWADDEKLISYSLENDIPIRVKESPDKKAIENMLSEEILSSDGILKKTETQRFYIHFPKDEVDD